MLAIGADQVLPVESARPARISRDGKKAAVGCFISTARELDSLASRLVAKPVSGAGICASGEAGAIQPV
jgi:hypothetical protein